MQGNSALINALGPGGTFSGVFSEPFSKLLNLFGTAATFLGSLLYDLEICNVSASVLLPALRASKLNAVLNDDIP